MKLLVLAAGIGSRFGGVKQLAQAGPCGETLLEYNLYDARRAGFDSVVFLIRKDIEADFREAILARLPPDLGWELAYQSPMQGVPEKDRGRIAAAGRTKPWGTGHALLCAEAQLEGQAFGVVNADDYYGRKGFEAVAACLAARDRGPGAGGAGSGRPGLRGLDTERPARFCLAGYRLGGVVPPTGYVSRAVCALDKEGFLDGIVEHVKVKRWGDQILSFPKEGPGVPLSPDALASMNLWGLGPSVFPRARALFEAFLAEEANWAKGEFYLPALVGALVAAGEARVRVLPVEERHFGLTNPEDLGVVREALARRISAGDYPSPLWGKGAGACGPGREEA